MKDGAALSELRRVDGDPDVLLNPFGGAAEGLFRASLVFSDGNGLSTAVGAERLVADEPWNRADERLYVLLPLGESIERGRRLDWPELAA